MAEKAEKVEEEQDGRDGSKRWTAKRRAALVLSILRGETSVAQCRPGGPTTWADGR